MGQSLTVTVFYGAAFPDEEETGLSPRLTVEATEACGEDPNSADERGEWEWHLEKHHPRTRGFVDSVMSGVGDYTTSHLAAAGSVVKSYDGLMRLPATGDSDEAWRMRIEDALRCLEWVDYDGNVVDAPDLTIGWHVAGAYW